MKRRTTRLSSEIEIFIFEDILTPKRRTEVSIIMRNAAKKSGYSDKNPPSLIGIVWRKKLLMVPLLS